MNLRDKISQSNILPKYKEWLNYFLESAMAEKGLAHLTLVAYRDDILQFLQFATKEKISVSDITNKNIEKFFSNIVHSKNTQARKLAALRQFYNFLWREKYITSQPLKDIANPKPARPLPYVLSVGEMELLLSSFHSLVLAEQWRLKAMVELLYGGGLRVSEMLTLKLEDFFFQKKLIKVIGKGQKERWVMMNDHCVTAIKKYLEQRDNFLPKGTESAYLFPSSGKKGAVSQSGHMTRQRFGQLLKSLALNAGLSPDKVTPHGLRHAFATHFLAGGGDVRSLQILLGHQHINTTAIYSHLDMSEKKKLVLGKHPMAKKNS